MKFYMEINQIQTRCSVKYYLCVIDYIYSISKVRNFDCVYEFAPLLLWTGVISLRNN
jgi:hypothetical protein